MNVADITAAFNNIRYWFVEIGKLLFDEFAIKIGGFTVSFGAFLVTGIMISFVLSVFWKGASK